jgi:hypothetical protein
MKREEAKDLFRKDKNSYGKPKGIIGKINSIYDDFESEQQKIGENIRNKLGPLLTLVTLLEKQKNSDDEMKKKLQKYIDDSIEQSKNSINYLKNLL